MRSQKTFRAAMVLMTAWAIALAAPASAQEPSRWTLRLRGLYSDYKLEAQTSYFSSTSRLELDRGKGVEVAAELRPSPRIGLELSASRLSLDARYRLFDTRPVSFNPVVLETREIFSSRGDFNLEPVALSLLIHPWPGRRFDVYVGPQVAWTRFNIDVESVPERDAEFSYGGKIGAELRWGDSPWSAGLDFRHLEIPHGSSDRDLYGSLGLDVLSFGVGLHL